MEEDRTVNHRRYLERKALFKGFGYDIDRERAFILDKARPIAGRILEAGTGKGHFALELAKAGHRFTTFDISQTEQAFARLNLEYADVADKVDFRIEDGEHLSFHDRSFDVIFSVNLVHHLERPYAVVDELVRVLSEDGKLIISDFTSEGLVLMEKIHAQDGNRHEVGPASLSDLGRYLTGKGFWLEKADSRFQEVLVIHPPSR